MSDPAGIREGRARYNATILGERIHHGTIMVIRVQPDEPIPEPSPGQWLELGLGAWEPVRSGAEAGTPRRLPPDGIIRRAYSISSPILDPDADRLLAAKEWEGFEFFLSLVVPPAERAQRVPNLTGRLFGLKSGDRLLISEQPMGDYTLDPVEPGDNVLFLATGTGEAPHNFMIWELLRRGHRGRIASVVSVRSEEDLAYDPVHRRLTGMFPDYRYAAISTRDPGSPGRHLQDLYREGELATRAGFALEPGSTRIFLCGNPGMIGPPRLLSGRRQFPDGEGMVELLEEAGFNADARKGKVDIHYERYW
jgi:ferredoxin--NADP+ reductase